ncbi:MAG: LamG domain-containing protein, partial [Chloroflexi bacterium]|nr:LamG domain-containing protein [Chloroflexota bacterium]
GTIELKVVDGVSFGRLNAQDEWTLVENQSDFFAPGGDPLGYLNAAENIQEAGDRVQDAGSGAPDLDTALANPYSVLRGAYSVYTFDLNGPKYARFMRDQTEEYLSRTGELPSGMELGLNDAYLNMQGHGEIWVDAETNLPIRQIIRLEFPAEPGALNWVSADITTDFSGWEQGLTTSNHGAVALARLRENPTALFTDPQSLFPNSSFLAPANVQQFAFNLGLRLLVLGLVALLITYRRSPQLYAAISLTVIFSMLVTPLMQSNQVYAFYERQRAEQAEHEQQAAQQEHQEQLQADISGRSFDPHQRPSFDRSTDRAVAADSLPRGEQPLDFYTRAPQTSPTASGCDSDADCDGLSDNIEMYETGTWVDDADTDDDFILDGIEVAGFILEKTGERWYLDPRNPDSNGDGLLDHMECPELVSTTGTPPAANAQCSDTDDDGTPDVFDFDNDGDGVPDTRDVSPDMLVGDPDTGLNDEQFSYDIANIDPGNLVFVDFELRPTNSEHLWYTGNVLDWPNGDTQGQVRRQGGSTTAKTFFDFDFDTYQNSATADHGDLQVNPLLEIQIPYDSGNPTGGLPIKSAITNTDAITGYYNIDWLDTQTLAEYGISVNYDAQAGDTLWVYVPLINLKDSVGDSPVALTGRMLYQPEVANWGGKHQAKLVWMINALVDTCDTRYETMPEEFTYEGQTINRDDDDAYESWCAMDSYGGKDVWYTSQTVIQTYYDDFYITGMSVREDHGIDLAIIAETDTSLAYESNLWHLANTLQQTWLQGQSYSSERFDVFDIDAVYTNWGITDALAITELALESQTSLGDVATIHNGHVLSTTYPSAVDGDSATLLYAAEETYRSLGLADVSTGDAGNDLGFAFPLATDTDTTAILRWAPFSYDAATDEWAAADYATYIQSLGQNLAGVFSNGVLNSMVNYESVSDYAALRTGAVQLALSYYMSIYNGASLPVVVAGDRGTTTALQSVTYTQNPAITVAQIMLNGIRAFYNRLDLSVTSVNGDDLLSTWRVLADSSAAVLQAIDDADQGIVTNYNTAFRELYDYYKTYTFDTSGFELVTPLANTLLGSTVTTSIESIQKLGYGLNSAQNLTIVGMLGKALYALKNLRYYVLKVMEIKEFALKSLVKLNKGFSAYSVLSLAYKVTLAITPVIFGLVSGSFEVTDLDFTAALAAALAEIIVAIIMFVLGSNPVGALILGILNMIDALIGVICASIEAANGEKNIDKTVDTWVCAGIVKAAAKAITYLIFDQTPLVDLQKDNRLDAALRDPTLTNPGVGVVTNNGLNVHGVITTNLYLNEPNVLGYTYWYQLSDDNLNDSTFAYRFQSSPDDFSVKQNQVSWDRPDEYEEETTFDIADGKRYYKVFYPANNFILEYAGINRQVPVYLTEAFNMNAQECWIVPTFPPIPVCYLRNYKKSVHVDLSTSFVFDIFPDTLTGFMKLASDDRGVTYRLTWDDSFPTQWDADGDGLISRAKGGNDPNDGNPDTDSDGLSDLYEYEIGSQLDAVDTDRDGLTDYWEVFYNTDPNKADSDRDGLVDGREVFHSNLTYPYKSSFRTDLNSINPYENETPPQLWSGGWEIVYDFESDGTPLTTWVNADPTDFDSDDDSITDNLEYIYGYNPNVLSALSVLSLKSGLPAGNYYRPGQTVVYTATVTNQLNNKYAQGLLQAEYPIDNPVSTEVMEILTPLASTTMYGSVDIDSNISASEVASLTIRAGAIIDDLRTGRLAWLHLNEQVGSTTFADDSLTGHDFTCSGDDCPTANGSYLNFAGGVTDDDEGDVIFLTDQALQIHDFTMGAWIYPTGFESAGTVFFSNGIRFMLFDSPNSSGLFPAVDYNTGSQDVFISWLDIDIPYNRLTHLMFTWDKQSNGTVTITPYINGDQLGAIKTNQPSVAYTAENAYLSPVGRVDDFEFYPTILSASDVRSLVHHPSLQFDFGTMSDISNQNNW